MAKLLLIGFLIILSPNSWAGAVPASVVEAAFTVEYQMKECRGVLSVKQKAWLYEAGARRIVPPFSPAWCRKLGVVPFTDFYPKGKT